MIEVGTYLRFTEARGTQVLRVIHVEPGVVRCVSRAGAAFVFNEAGAEALPVVEPQPQAKPVKRTLPSVGKLAPKPQPTGGAA